MLKKINTNLFCINCNEETEHIILYLDDEIKSIECKKCHRISGIDKNELLELYTIDTVKHILTEPFKLNKKIKEEGSTFLYSFPKRIFSKPYRIVKDIFNILEN
ncbi:bh protein [Halocella sp. SP3-1]|uniref:bh protein n=1 Tax=Halocella sp. SP3-1 TaxID=2382161 RepID=UPI000F75CD60|nr:bh protein [Halocella sp. SP3-1]AZO94762.1 bh protein [Halocella sp. SP3-1]